MLDTSSSFTDVFYPLGEMLLSGMLFVSNLLGYNLNFLWFHNISFEKTVFPQNRTTLMDALWDCLKRVYGSTVVKQAEQMSKLASLRKHLKQDPKYFLTK